MAVVPMAMILIWLETGDVVYLQVLGQEIVLLGSYQAACDILEKRSGIYSNRPESVMVKLYVPPAPSAPLAPGTC